MDTQPSKIHGKGVFATQDYKSGDQVLKLFWLINPALFTPHWDESIAIIFPYDLGVSEISWHINHQFDANCIVEKQRHVWYAMTRTDIRKGEEITLDYTTLPEFMRREVENYIELL